MSTKLIDKMYYYTSIISTNRQEPIVTRKTWNNQIIQIPFVLHVHRLNFLVKSLWYYEQQNSYQVFQWFIIYKF